MEGDLSAMFITDLSMKKIVGTFDKCSNQDEVFGIKNGKLVYTCLYRCSQKEINYFNKKTKKFEKSIDKNACDLLNKNSKVIEKVIITNFEKRYSKNGVSYKSQKIPLSQKNCGKK